MSKYKIDVIDTDKSKIPQRECAKEGIMPKYPFSMLISGMSGGGKTNLLLNLLTKQQLYGKFFHYILVFSPTAGEYDDSYKALKLPQENFIKEFNGETLQKIIEKRKQQIKADGIEHVSKNSRMLIVMDDVIADRSFLESPEALKMFCLLRHYLVSIIVLLQSYIKLPKTLRKNCNAMCIFPSKQSEVETLIDEITPAGMKKREFEKVIDYCCSDKYSFIYINYHADKDKQIKKNLDEVITKEKLRELTLKDGNDKEVKEDKKSYDDKNNMYDNNISKKKMSLSITKLLDLTGKSNPKEKVGPDNEFPNRYSSIKSAKGIKQEMDKNTEMDAYNYDQFSEVMKQDRETRYNVTNLYLDIKNKKGTNLDCFSTEGYIDVAKRRRFVNPLTAPPHDFTFGGSECEKFGTGKDESIAHDNISLIRAAHSNYNKWLNRYNVPTVPVSVPRVT